MVKRYSNDEPEPGQYEQHIGFSWNDNRTNKPQTLTIGFQLTSEMEDDFLPDDENLRVEKAEKQKEDWVSRNLDLLLEYDLVEYVFGHEDIQSVSELKANLSEISVSWQ